MSAPRPDRARVVVGLLLAVACVATQWNIDGNRRVDLRIYLRAVASSGDHLYDYGSRALNFLYPPFAAIVLRPLGWMPESTATRVWLIASVAMGLAATAAVVSRTDGVRRPDGPTAVAAAGALLWSVPTYLTFRMGQINALIVALVCVDVVLLRRHSRAGGIATGFAAAIKVTPLVLVAALIWARRRDGWRAVLTFVATVAVTAVVMPGPTVRFWTEVVFEAGGIGGSGDPFNASIFSVAGLVTPDATLRRLLWVVASAAVGLAALRGLRRRFADDVPGAVIVVMCLATAVSPLAWVHHHGFTTLALALWCIRSTRPWQWLLTAVGAFALVDPLALGEESMLRTTLLVAFAVATVVAAPGAPAAAPATAEGAPDFHGGRPIADNDADPIEERANDVRPDPAASR